MAVEVRKLTIDDYDHLVRLWSDAGLEFRPHGRDAREVMAVEMLRPETAFFGVYLDGNLVGAGLASYEGRKGWINRVAVHPDYRRRGFATLVIQECERFLQSLGATVIGCLIHEFNTPSMALVAKLGFSYAEKIEYFSKRDSEES